VSDLRGSDYFFYPPYHVVGGATGGFIYEEYAVHVATKATRLTG